MTTHDHNAALLADILNPDRSPVDICTTHNLSFTDLAAFLKGPLYQSLADATRQLARARTELLALEIEPRALLALSITTDTDDQTRPVHETIRKSATKLLTIARQKTAGSSAPGDPARRAGSPPSSAEPAGEVPSPRGAGGLPSKQPAAPHPQPPPTPVTPRNLTAYAGTTTPVLARRTSRARVNIPHQGPKRSKARAASRNFE